MNTEKIYCRIYEQYREAVVQQAFVATQCKMLSEDIAQNIFMKLWEKKDCLMNIENVQSFLFTLTKNETIDHLRKRKNDKVAVKEFFFCYNTNVYAEDGVKEMNKLVHQAKEKLSERQRLIYDLRKEHGWKREKIASVLKISECTVKVTIQNANKSLRKYLRRLVA
jgi:RNA polymerase sigma-70 factor (ECF subfamily)